MGRGEEVGAGRQAAQIESDCKIRVKSLDNCNSTPGCFFRCAAAIRGDGDNIIATWAEVRKDHMGRIHATRKNHCGDGICLSTPGRACVAEIDRHSHRG